MAALVLVALMAGETAAQQTASDGRSAAATKRLFEAVHNNNLGAVQISIGAGADITATNEQGLLAVDVAVDRGHFEIAHFLLSIRNFRRTKRAEAAPPPPLAAAPPAPAAALSTTPAKQPDVAPLPPAAMPPPAPWPANTPNPFDPATTPPSSNLALVGPVFGPGKAPPAAPAPPSVAAADSAVVQAPSTAAEAPPKSQPAQPGFFGRLTGLFTSDDEEAVEPAGAPPSIAALDGEPKKAEVPAKTAPRISEEKPRPAPVRPVVAPSVARPKPPAPKIPPPTTGNPFDPRAAAPGSALPVIGAVQKPAAAPTAPVAEAPPSPPRPIIQELPPATSEAASAAKTDTDAAPKDRIAPPVTRIPRSNRRRNPAFSAA
ncbi:MAG: ankyrin repeat domain-containing protein [Rhodospirillales bacterium]|nr:ankyrin repeat domain-containing protein [Rhodospirillales bacterium]